MVTNNSEHTEEYAPDLPTKNWYGISYLSVLDHGWVHRLWKRFCCVRGWHLWDETAGGDTHSLYCDACGFNLGITYGFPDEWIETPEGSSYIEWLAFGETAHSGDYQD